MRAAFFIDVYDYGDVGAGKIIHFPADEERRSVSIPRGALEDDRFVLFNVNGESLSDLGIHTGDDLLCRRNFEISEITEKRICIVLYEGQLMAKRVRHNDDETITLISAGKRFETMPYDEVEIKALAIEHKREL